MASNVATDNDEVDAEAGRVNAHTPVQGGHCPTESCAFSLFEFGKFISVAQSNKFW